MQSLQRAISRNNAVIISNPFTYQEEVFWKKGLEKNIWEWAVKQSIQPISIQKERETSKVVVVQEKDTSFWDRIKKWFRRIMLWR